MGKAYKIVVTGAFNAGKTEFIRNASDIETVSTERPITDSLSGIKDTTTVAMDYGQATINDHLLHLYGTPGQERFEFMQEILSQEMHGLLLIVNSADRPSLSLTRRILRRLRRKRNIPILIVTTHQDDRRAMSPQDISKSLRLEDSIPVIPCDPRVRSDTHQVLGHLVTLLN